MQTVDVDCLILGGGVSGLWLLNRLRQGGYSALLLHDGLELGGVQTLNSAGMIHGGLRFGLGALRKDQTLDAMPGLWRDCLQGSGELDLRAVSLLSDAQYLWAGPEAAARALLLASAMTLSGKARRLPVDQRPELLRHPALRSAVFRVEHPVIDMASLVRTLAAPVADCLYQVAQQDLHLETDGRFGTRALFIRKGRLQLRLHPRRLFLTGGAGNGALLQAIGLAKPPMIRKPVHMTCLTHPDLPEIHGHCQGSAPRPRLTLTTHPLRGGRLWYVGGDVAESGAHRDEATQIAAVRAELARLLPWVNLKGAQWRTLMIDRIYPSDRPLRAPIQAHVRDYGNNTLIWPARLVLAPDAARQALDGLAAAGVSPQRPQPDALPLPRPEPGVPLWEKLLR